MNRETDIKMIWQKSRRTNSSLQWCLSFLFVFSVNTAQSQVCEICDPTLVGAYNRTIAYKKRGSGKSTRCEGFYRQKVGAELTVVHVVKGDFRFKLNRKEVVNISSPIINKQTICVRAVGIPSNTYYRMDAQINPNKVLSWPIGDVINGQRLSSQKIGVYGFLKRGRKKIYIPVRAKAKMASVIQEEKIKLYLRAPVQLDEVWWRLKEGHNCSRAGKWNRPDSIENQELIKITLPQQSSVTGELCVEVAAKPSTTADWLQRHTVHLKVKNKK
jgi:hypothetical protein